MAEFLMWTSLPFEYHKVAFFCASYIYANYASQALVA